MAVSLWAFAQACASGTSAALLHPTASLVWKLRIVQALTKEFGLESIEFNQCAFGRRPKDWDPSSGDVRTLLPTTVLTNCSFLKLLNKKCADVSRRSHGSSAGGDLASELCMDLKACMAACTRTAWLLGARPEPKPLPADLELAQLTRNILHNPFCCEEFVDCTYSHSTSYL